MNRYIIRAGMTIAFAANLFTVSGQNLSQLQKRQMINAALNCLDDYRAYHGMGDEEVYYNFLDLFVSDSTLVYNDQLGLGGRKQIPIKEYADRQRTKLNAPIIKFSNIKIGKVWNEGGNWKVELSYNKSASYFNSCGLQFSTKDFYQKDFDERAIIVFSNGNKDCKIESINGNIDSNRHLSEDYLVYVKTSTRDSLVTYCPPGGNKNKIEFNSAEQAMFENGVDLNGFAYADPDVVLKPTVDNDCHILKMTYKTRRWKVRLHDDISLGNLYDIKCSCNGISTSSNGNEFGVDFGYTIPSKGIVKFSANAGLGIATSTIKFNTPGWNYSYTTSEDVDGDEYIRRYQVGATQQSISMAHLDIPIYLDVDFCFSRYISAYLQAGIKNYMKIKANTDNFTSSVYIDGLYPQYGNLVMNEHWGFNGFGQHDVSKDDVNDASIQAKSFVMDYFGGLGLRIKPAKTLPLALELGLQYQKSVSDIIECDPIGLDLSNRPGNQAIYQYTVGNGENYRMLSNGISSLKSSSLKFNIGLIYKF